MKKTKKWQIALICILCVSIYALPMIGIMIFGYFDEKAKAFEMKGDVIEISKGKLIIEKEESFYDEESKSYYITGYLRNTTDNQYDSMSVEYRVYDKEGNILGEATAYLETLQSEKTWKFKATYAEVDANEVSAFELLEVDYY